MRNMPHDPLYGDGVAGRAVPHLRGLAQAESFLTGGSTTITEASVQRMLLPCLAHRIMFQLETGGHDLLELYGETDRGVLSLTEDIIRLILVSS